MNRIALDRNRERGVGAGDRAASRALSAAALARARRPRGAAPLRPRPTPGRDAPLGPPDGPTLPAGGRRSARGRLGRWGRSWKWRPEPLQRGTAAGRWRPGCCAR